MLACCAHCVHGRGEGFRRKGEGDVERDHLGQAAGCVRPEMEYEIVAVCKTLGLPCGYGRARSVFCLGIERDCLEIDGCRLLNVHLLGAIS
jgi:hypothetical protein